MPDPAKEMIKAAKKGDLKKIKELLAKEPDLVRALDTDGSTPLHCAVWKGQVEAVALLLESGADVNAHNQNDHYGTTPLHAAAHANQTKIAQLLVEHGADLKAQDMNGKTPLFHTTFHKSTAAAKYLQSVGAV